MTNTIKLYTDLNNYIFLNILTHIHRLYIELWNYTGARPNFTPAVDPSRKCWQR